MSVVGVSNDAGWVGIVALYSPRSQGGACAAALGCTSASGIVVASVGARDPLRSVLAARDVCGWSEHDGEWVGAHCSVHHQTGRWLARDASVVAMGHNCVRSAGS